jgi:hypothetical protein
MAVDYCAELEQYLSEFRKGWKLVRHRDHPLRVFNAEGIEMKFLDAQGREAPLSCQGWLDLLQSGSEPTFTKE